MKQYFVRRCSCGGSGWAHIGFCAVLILSSADVPWLYIHRAVGPLTHTWLSVYRSSGIFSEAIVQNQRGDVKQKREIEYSLCREVARARFLHLPAPASAAAGQISAIPPGQAGIQPWGGTVRPTAHSAAMVLLAPLPGVLAAIDT